jgi:hypothetical protein
MLDANEPADGDRTGRGRADPPTGERVRFELERFAELIQDLAGKDSLLGAVPILLGRLGDLRRLLFDYEVRVTERLLPVEDPGEREARNIIREAEERKRTMMDEWQGSWTPYDADGGSDEDDESG